MSMLSLAGLVLASVAAVVVVVLLAALVAAVGRRRVVEEPSRPQTVADLIRLRSETSTVPARTVMDLVAARAQPAEVVEPDHAASIEKGEPQPETAAPETQAGEIAESTTPPALVPDRSGGATPWRRAGWISQVGAPEGPERVAVGPVETRAAPEDITSADRAVGPAVIARGDGAVGPVEPGGLSSTGGYRKPTGPVAVAAPAVPPARSSSVLAAPRVAAVVARERTAPGALAAVLGQALAIGSASSGPDDRPPPLAAALSRRRRSTAEQAAEQAAADLALLRTFGFADPDLAPVEPAVVSLGGRGGPASTPAEAGSAQPVRFRAVRRGGVPVEGATVMLLDDHGQQAAAGTTDADGRGEVLAPRPGSYVLVSAAPHHQPGAVALTVVGEPAETDVLLVRSASVAGAVRSAGGAVAGARVTLVQDGHLVGSADSDAAGEYRLVDLAAGEYGLSVAAAGCAPVAIVLRVPDETDLRHDVDLGAAASRGRSDDDRVGGYR